MAFLSDLIEQEQEQEKKQVDIAPANQGSTTSEDTRFLSEIAADESNVESTASTNVSQDSNNPENLILNELAYGANEALASGLQLPVNLGRELYGLTTGRNPFNADDRAEIPGETVVRDLFESLGLLKENPATGILARIGREVAQAPLYAAAPLKAAASGVQLSSKLFAPFLQSIIDLAKRRPGSVLASEAGISTLGATGAEIGRDIATGIGADPQVGDDLGFALGALSPIPAASIFNTSRRLNPTTAVVRGARNLFSNDAAERNAGRLLRQNMETGTAENLRAVTPDNPGLLNKANTTSNLKATIGEVYDDKGLLNLQSFVDQRPRDFSGPEYPFTRRVSDVQKAIEEAAPPVGSLQFFNNKVDPLINKVQDRIVNVAKNLDDKLRNFKPTQTNENDQIEISELAREEFESIYKIAKQQESGLWEQIGGNYNTDGVVDRAKSIIAEAAQFDQVDPFIRSIAGKDAVTNEAGDIVTEAVPSVLKQVTSEKNIASLIKQLGRLSRKARQDSERSYYLRLFSNEVRDLIKTQGGDPNNLQVARAYTRRMKEVFNQNKLDDLLRFLPQGGRKLDPGLTLQKLITPNNQGLINAQNLLKTASEFNPESLKVLNDSMERFLIAKFANQTMFTDANNITRFNTRAAETFVNNNPALNLFPKLRTQMLDSVEAQRLADKADKRLQTALKGLQQSKVAKETIGDDFFYDTILNSNNPIKKLRQYMNIAQKDPSGEALNGMKRVFFKNITDKMITTSKSSGEEKLSATALNSYFKNTTQRQLVKELFGSEGLKVFENISKGVNLISRMYKGKPSIQDADVEFKKFRGLIGNIATAMGGSLAQKLPFQFQNKGLLFAGMAGRSARAFLDTKKLKSEGKVMQILEQAMFDEILAKELLIKAGSIPKSKPLKDTFPRLSTFDIFSLNEDGDLSQNSSEIIP